MRSKIFQRILDETPKEVEIFVDWYADLVVRINELLAEQNINKKELAKKMDKKPSEISKWLSGEHNFTLRSLAKLSAELGEPLLEVPKRKATTEFTEETVACRVHQFVRYNNYNTQSDAKTWQVAEDAAPYNDLNYAG